MPSPDSQDQQPADSSRSEPDHIDAEFARIVAGFDAAPSWPGEQEERERPSGPIWPASGPVLNRPAHSGPAPTDPSLLDALDSFGAHLPDDAPDKFVPPPPPPLPRIPAVAIVAVLAIIAGFVLFMQRDLLPLSGPVSMVLGLACVFGGATALIMRLRPGGEDDQPPGDGAVV